ncbi:MAG: hypothetical protein IJI07_00275 [Flexilinea sp.]|nr:hypothetical protein [Flexilinea sp.]
MQKRYIIPLVLVFVLMSAAMVSAQNYCYGCCTGCYPYTNPQPVVRECASFVSDVTIPDGSYIAPGSTFTKTWRIRNNGTTTWTTNYRLVFVSGTQMSAQNSVNLPYNVGPGQTVDISVQMTAPTASGSYKSSWMLVNESGTQFGVGTNCNTAVYALIVNYVQTTNYNYNYCYPQWRPQPQPKPQQPPKPPCNGWNCGPNWGTIPNFGLDEDMNKKPQQPEPHKPPKWFW